MNLEKYNQKRDFSKTSEPKGGKEKKKDVKPIFVIQKHNASHLHYDFRLAIDGVLKSWAIPKEPPMKTAEKRLAIETEDHPMEYANFSGTIPEGSYGGGTVEIWDQGVFENLTHDKQKNSISAKKGFENGHLQFMLNGKKLKGKYVLTFFKKEGKNKQWLLIKMKED